MKREYTKFQTHIDNVLEKVSGEHLNKIQDAVNNTQRDVSELYGRNFLNDCLFVLEHNPDINMMFYMDFATQDQIFRAKSNGYTHDTEKLCVTAKEPVAIIHSTPFKSGYGGTIDEVMIKADAIIPIGCTIRYYVSADLNNYYPVKLGTSELFTIPKYSDTIYLRIELIQNKRGETPSLFAVAIYYKDWILHQKLSIDKPPLSPSPIDGDVEIGDTILQYKDGKLHRVLEQSGNITELVFDEGGTLTSVLLQNTIGKYEQALIYAEEPEMDNSTVLKSIRTRQIEQFKPEDPEGDETE